MDEKFFLPTVLELQTSLEGYNFILPFQRLEQDISSELNPCDAFPTETKLILKSLYQITLHPRGCVENLVFPKDDTLSLELALLKEYYGKGLILNSGKESEEPDMEFLKKISFEAGVDIAQGFVPAYSNLSGSKMDNVSAISSALWQKFSESLPPAFIGEIYLKKELTAEQICLIEGIKNIQREKKIPALIRVPSSLQALQFLNFYQKQEIPKSLLFFFVQNPNKDKRLVQLLSIPQISVCFGVLKSEGPTNNPYLNQDFFLDILSKEWPTRIILTPGVIFRCNLRNFGGPGYSCAFDLFGVQQHIDVIQKLQWYQKEQKAKVAVKYWECCWCKKSFPETQESYKKFDFQYCSTKCLAEHRKKNFKFN